MWQARQTSSTNEHFIIAKCIYVCTVYWHSNSILAAWRDTTVHRLLSSFPNNSNSRELGGIAAVGKENRTQKTKAGHCQQRGRPDPRELAGETT